jgi:hypothetical protein
VSDRASIATAPPLIAASNGVTGIVALAALAALVTFFVFGGPFGYLNDALNALLGVVGAVLALMVHRTYGGSVPAVATACVGAVVAVIGSWLVITDTTTFVFAGFVSTVGFALIGSWVVAANRSGTLGRALSRGSRRLGIVAGAAMAVGIVGVAGVIMGIDSFEATPPWLWLYGIGWLGIYILYPAWCVAVAMRSNRA